MPLTRSQAAATEQSKLEKKEGQESASTDNAFERLPDELLLKVTKRCLSSHFLCSTKPVYTRTKLQSAVDLFACFSHNVIAMRGQSGAPGAL